MIDGIVNERNHCASISGPSPGGGVIPGRLACFSAAEVFAVGLLGDGWCGDHHVSCDAAPIGGECYEVGTLEPFVRSPNELFGVNVPAGSAAQQDPLVTQSIVTADCGTLGTGGRMAAGRSKLMAACSAGGERSVVTTLPGTVDRKSEMLGHGQSQGGSMKVVL